MTVGDRHLQKENNIFFRTHVFILKRKYLGRKRHRDGIQQL